MIDERNDTAAALAQSVHSPPIVTGSEQATAWRTSVHASTPRGERNRPTARVIGPALNAPTV